ncbi:ParB/RepB/Spo0J family partition protein [Traorella massiliensis]|uniref:ParB/RepB/Spo0J family partition protein n=1 Tax=Traorella massiliensis TaxID=1903263 RepID=UPI0008F834DE|nr:ParB/RepB/Spo0J family partition protein [Traorella massiliensis]
MITNISIDKLYSHPKNPRQDLGNLSELTESILANGVMQNLTVVPKTDDDGYFVVIGNRRLAAAKKAGLKELPCVVSNMDEKQQQATMLLENMQRSDLTPYEQAQGFQMCLDLGMTEDELSKQTGFSKKTVKHRLNMLKFDAEEVKKTVVNGASIQDYIDLEKVKNDDTKKELLQYMGTTDFRYHLNSAIETEKIEKKVNQTEKKIALFAKKVEDRDLDRKKYTYLQFYRSPEDVKEEGFKERKEYLYTRSTYGINVYGSVSEEEVNDKAEKEEKRNKIITELENLFKTAQQTRIEFIKNILNDKTASHRDVFYTEAIKILSTKSYSSFDAKLFKKIIECDIKESLNKNNAEKVFEATVFASLEESHPLSCYSSWSGEYNERKAQQMNEYYKFLISIGYQPSEAENQLLDGTHKSYPASAEK